MRNEALTPVREVLPGTRRYTQHTIYELAETIRARDIITYAHCRRVAIYSGRLARALGWTRPAARDLCYAALVHDLGKTWIRNSILHKECALSQEEWQEMLRHPAIAARILDAYDMPEGIVDIVLHHHERYDGCGYPDHLLGNDIPLGARLLTVADVFDALTSARSYKDAMSIEAARERILAGSGTHFDPAVAPVFAGLVTNTPEFLLPPTVEPIIAPSTRRAWARHDYLLTD